MRYDADMNDKRSSTPLMHSFIHSSSLSTCMRKNACHHPPTIQHPQTPISPSHGIPTALGTGSHRPPQQSGVTPTRPAQLPPCVTSPLSPSPPSVPDPWVAGQGERSNNHETKRPKRRNVSHEAWPAGGEHAALGILRAPIVSCMNQPCIET